MCVTTVNPGCSILAFQPCWLPRKIFQLGPTVFLQMDGQLAIPAQMDVPQSLFSRFTAHTPYYFSYRFLFLQVERVCSSIHSWYM